MSRHRSMKTGGKRRDYSWVGVASSQLTVTATVAGAGPITSGGGKPFPIAAAWEEVGLSIDDRVTVIRTYVTIAGLADIPTLGAGQTSGICRVGLIVLDQTLALAGAFPGPLSQPNAGWFGMVDLEPVLETATVWYWRGNIDSKAKRIVDRSQGIFAVAEAMSGGGAGDTWDLQAVVRALVQE